MQVSIPSSSHLPTHERDLATSPGSDTATLVDSDVSIVDRPLFFLLFSFFSQEQYTSYLRDLKIVNASVSNSISGPPAPVVHAEVNLRPPKATAAYMHPLYSQGLDTTSMRQHRYTLGAVSIAKHRHTLNDSFSYGPKLAEDQPSPPRRQKG